MSNNLGKIFKITTFGESHGKAVGVIIDGCPAGLEISVGEVQSELDKRRPGQSKLTTSRQEKDKVEILSGVFEGKTIGTAIGMIVYNKDMRSSDYDSIKELFRPGHADYTYQAKYGIRDWRGSGRASARETIARVAAGTIAKKLLQKEGIKIVGYVKQVGQEKVNKIDEAEINKNPLRCPDSVAVERMSKVITQAQSAGDSVGGVVEVVAHNVPPGLGEPVFGKLSADLAQALVGIPAVKGFEIGNGFGCVTNLGSANNDELTNKNGKIRTNTNQAGGIVGGISNGEDVVVRIALKPPSSISKSQQTVNKDGQISQIKVEGRHDPCVCPRAVPVAEAMMALVLTDHYLQNKLSRV